MAKLQRSQADLESQLSEQLQFLRASAESYDKGFLGEAKRLAHTIRLLVHDTSKSHSLLGQLDRKSGEFFDSAFPTEPGNKSAYAGLVMMGVGGRDGGRYLPMGDGVPFTAWVPFDDWWNRVVFIDDRNARVSRADLVLTVANQDGGSHVDPALDETYLRLTRSNSMGWVRVKNGVETPVADAAGASVRQIAHELLKSIDKSVSWSPKYEVGVYTGAIAVFDSPFPPGFQPQPERPRDFRKVGRNERCPCGSGLKFKKCHGSARAA